MNEGALTPVLQLVHYSDIHLVSKRFLEQRRLMAAIESTLPRCLRQGLARADIAALEAFERSLGTLHIEGAWAECPTWLVDTGDGTTFGDIDSLKEWIDHWTPRFIAAAGSRADHVMLYGNHDAWPGENPYAKPHDLDRQRDLLRRDWFRNTWPTSPLRFSAESGTGVVVDLYVVNTVDHRMWPTLLQRGLAAPDRYWERPPPMFGPTPAHDLEQLANLRRPEGRPWLRILATHYPVADKAAPPWVPHKLANRDEFAQTLSSRHQVAHPLVQVVLSGHTHQAFPPIGALAPTMAQVRQPPLRVGTLQIVTPSLSQRVLPESVQAEAFDDHADECQALYPHQFTLLRIYQDRRQPMRLVLERTTYGREGSGEFAPIPLSRTSNSQAERIVLSCEASVAPA